MVVGGVGFFVEYGYLYVVGGGVVCEGFEKFLVYYFVVDEDDVYVGFGEVNKKVLLVVVCLIGV